MRYYYEPFKLKAWVRDNQNLRVNSSDDSAALKPDRLTQLEEDFHLASETEESIISWFNQLSRRERNASTHLLQKEWKEPHALPVLRDCLKKQAHEDHRLFKRIVDATYNTCDVENLWDLVKLSFGVHHQKIQKRMKQENQHRKWYTLLSSPDPVYHLAKTAYESDLTFLEELETFYLTENYPLYKLVMIEAFGMADEDFFLKEKEVYKSYFNTVKSENQQKLAESLIRQCELDNVEELGRFIYERLKTYMKKPSLWRHVGEEEKKRFSSWIIRKELRDFFGDINQNHERYLYWEKYIPKLIDVMKADKNSVLIMTFTDVVIIEKLGTGAVYVYEKKIFESSFRREIDRIRAKETSGWIIKEVTHGDLRNIDLAINRLMHTGGWQDKFDTWLKNNLGWEVDRDVLLEKENKNTRNEKKPR